MTGPRSPMFAPPRRARVGRLGGATRWLVVGVVLVAVVLAVSAGAMWGYAAVRLDPTPLAGLATADGVVTDTLVVVTDGAVLHGVVLVQTGTVREQPVVLVVPPALPASAASVATFADTHRDGGIEALARAVTDYTGLSLEHHVVADVAILERATDALGGVEHCDGGRCRTVDGAALTAPVAAATDPVTSVRATWESGRAILAELGRPRTLLAPLDVKRTVDVLTAVRTDLDLAPGDLLSVADRWSGLAADELDVRVVPSLVTEGRLQALPEQAETIFQALRDGGPLPDVGAEPPAEVAPADVRVAVANGAGVEGLAGDVAGALEAAGFDVVVTGNADRFDLEITTITHGPDAEAHATLVARNLDGASRVSEDGPVTFEGETIDVLVTVGRDRAPA